MQRATSFRLSEEALRVLSDLEAATGLSGRKVLEGLLLGRYHIRERLFMVGTQWTAEEQAKMEDRPALPVNKLPPSEKEPLAKPVQDISSTKQVLRRKINPMTGKSYGPVPKS